MLCEEKGYSVLKDEWFESAFIILEKFLIESVKLNTNYCKQSLTLCLPFMNIIRDIRAIGSSYQYFAFLVKNVNGGYARHLEDLLFLFILELK